MLVFNEFNTKKLGLVSFLIGIFFLSSALPISGLFLIFSLILSFKKESILIKDKWNYPLLISSLLMLISTGGHFLRYENYIYLALESF